MKLLFDLFPVVLFFIVYKLVDIYAATMVAIAASAVQVLFTYFVHKKIENMQIITLVILVVMGTLTIWLQDERFIKWKPTLVNWAMALGILGFRIIAQKNALQQLLGANLDLPPLVWKKMDYAWAIFLSSVGALNLWVAYAFSTDIWVNFKLFGIMGITLLFVLAQGIFLAKHLPQNNSTP